MACNNQAWRGRMIRARRRALMERLSRGGRQPSLRELAQQMGVCRDTVHKDVRWLVAAGYLRRPYKHATALQVLVPFLTTRR